MNHEAHFLIKKFFGFDFLEDFFQLYEWIKKNPQINLQDDLEIALLPVFDVFKEDFNQNNLFDFIHQNRFYNDPPEFVGLFRGFSDGLHWGYYFDSPDEFPPVVVNYYHSDSYEFEVDGDTTFEAIRKVLEERAEVDVEYFHEDEKYYVRRTQKHNQIRPLLMPFTPSRIETGETYTEIYNGKNKRNNLVIAPTYHRLGIVAPKETYKSIDEMPYELSPEQTEQYISLAYQALQEGFPATALQVAHNFWVENHQYREQINDLFKKSYEALGRKKLIPLLEAAIHSRKVFDKDHEEFDKSVVHRVDQFQTGMSIRFHRQKGQILEIQGTGKDKKATVKFENESELQSFLLKDYAFYFRIPSDNDFNDD